MRKRPYLQNYFYYTRTEKNACLAMAFLTVFFIFLPGFYPFIFPQKEQVDSSKFQAEIAVFQSNHLAGEVGEEPGRDFRSTEKTLPSELFFFDPNTAAKEDFVRLGISPRVAQAILNYRLKGGRFFKQEDFKRIYTLRKEDYERLKDWIKIERQGEQLNEKEAFVKQAEYSNPLQKATPLSKFQAQPPNLGMLDINTATAEDWQKLKGIGTFYAKRIVNFREKLGGFFSIHQVGETHGLPDSTFQKIQPLLQASPIFRKINLNSATLDELKSHPYLSNFQATVLFNYRQQHGNFTGMESLKKITAAFKDSDWARLEPYLSFDK